jgi:hypothetical protein
MPATEYVLTLSSEDIGLIRLGLNKCHRDCTPETREDVRKVEAKINAAIGSDVGMAEPEQPGGSDDYR